MLRHLAGTWLRHCPSTGIFYVHFFLLTSPHAFERTVPTKTQGTRQIRPMVSGIGHYGLPQAMHALVTGEGLSFVPRALRNNIRSSSCHARACFLISLTDPLYLKALFQCTGHLLRMFRKHIWGSLYSVITRASIGKEQIEKKEEKKQPLQHHFSATSGCSSSGRLAFREPMVSTAACELALCSFVVALVTRPKRD